MSPNRTAAGRRRAARAVLALAAVTACLGAALAYAMTRPARGHQELGEHHAVQQPSGGGPAGDVVPRWRERQLRPQLLESPPETTMMSDPQFRFNVPPRHQAAPAPPGPEPQPAAETSTRRFQCRVDGAEWGSCRSPYRLTGLNPGSHRFAVRVFNREDRVGEPASVSWRQMPAEVAAAPTQQAEPGEPMPFSIIALEEPEKLFPGLPARAIPVRITNPNSVPIEVTAITAAIGEAPANCPVENFALIPASASPADPVQVPAGGSVDLPTEGASAPTIRMLNLPVEQDACRGAEIPLVFSGEAHG